MNQLTNSVPADVTHALWRLSNFALAAYNSSLQNGQITQKNQLTVKTNILKFDYKEGNIEYQANHINGVSLEVDFASVYRFIESIKTTPEYSQAKDAISKHTGQPIQVCDQWLDSFFRLFFVLGDESHSEARTLRLIKNFCDSLDGIPVWMDVSVGINGVWPVDDGFVFGDYSIRRPTQDDLRRITEFTLFHNLGPFYERLPMCYVDFKFKTSNQNDVHKEMEVLVDTLSLVGVGSVYWDQMSIKCESPLVMSHRTGSSNSLAPAHKFPISKTQSTNLSKLFQITRPLMLSETPSDSLKSVMRALQRYRTALLDAKDCSSNIALSISCLEALFLRGKERSELKNRLSNRVALLFKCLDDNPLQVASQVSRAYEIRSAFVHGDDSPPESVKNLPELRKEIFEVARVCLVLFFQIQADLPKDDFISKLDKALLDDASLQKVKDTLSNKLLFRDSPTTKRP